MKIQVDGKQIYELSETQKKVIKNDIMEDIFDSDMVRRCKHVIEHPCERFLDKNRKHIEESLKSKGHTSIPSKKMDLASLYENEFPIHLKQEQDKENVVLVDGKEAFRISTLQKKLHKACGQEDPEKYMLEQMAWILQHKYERCFERLKLEWVPKLESRIPNIPLNPDEFAELVFSQSDYNNRSQREK